MWAVDLTHTTHTAAQTGIQQVCRNLYRALAENSDAAPVVFDRFSGKWRLPESRELARLKPGMDAVPPGKRSSAWTLGQKVRGYRARLTGQKQILPAIEGLFCPEIFDPSRDRSLFGANLPARIPRVAYFYDAIPVRYPQWTPKATVKRFPAYLAKLADFDHVACISRSSENDLLEYWKGTGIQPSARTSTIPLGLREHLWKADGERREAPPAPDPVVLMVGTLEARKNHLSLLGACEELWSSGMRFNLRLAGMLNRETGSAAAEKIRELSAAGWPIHWEGAVSNRRLAELYGEADIFVYPSHHEGFGLPVLEALAHGLPVLTTGLGALGELSGDGGCLACDGTREGIREALCSLVTEPQRRLALAEEARQRPIRTMRDAARELASLFQELSASSSC